jgi:hypothetical protein
VLDARARLGDAGRLEIRSAHEFAGDREVVSIRVDDHPREPKYSDGGCEVWLRLPASS